MTMTSPPPPQEGGGHTPKRFIIYTLDPAFARHRYAKTRVGAELVACLMGLQSCWPNPLKASRIQIAKYAPLKSSVQP